jgi:hypothetical protein
MPYRDELEALREREAALARELDETRRLRREHEKRALPVLESLRVASPCPARWEEMIGDERMRFCGTCAKNVYDLSAMTREEAEAFVERHGGQGVCVTFRRRRDGKVLTSDCPVGARRRRFGLGVVALAVTGAAASFGSARAPGPNVCDLPAPHARGLETPNGGVEAHVFRASPEPVFPMMGQLAPPPPPKKHAGRMTGCLCRGGDPLCSCL